MQLPEHHIHPNSSLQEPVQTWRGNAHPNALPSGTQSNHGVRKNHQFPNRPAQKVAINVFFSPDRSLSYRPAAGLLRWGTLSSAGFLLGTAVAVPIGAGKLPLPELWLSKAEQVGRETAAANPAAEGHLHAREAPVFPTVTTKTDGTQDQTHKVMLDNTNNHLLKGRRAQHCSLTIFLHLPACLSLSAAGLWQQHLSWCFTFLASALIKGNSALIPAINHLRQHDVRPLLQAATRSGCGMGTGGAGPGGHQPGAATAPRRPSASRCWQ